MVKNKEAENYSKTFENIGDFLITKIFFNYCWGVYRKVFKTRLSSCLLVHVGVLIKSFLS